MKPGSTPAPRPADPLDAAHLRSALSALGEPLDLEVLQSCTSTNSLLLERAGAEPLALLAERQTAGRGRRGRRWHAAPGASLTFSLRWRFPGGITRLAGLSLAVGVGVARVLHRLGAHEVGLKWPNDLLARSGKLGGILIETRSSAASSLAVIGVGLNLRAGDGLQARLGRRVSALESLLDGRRALDRNALAAELLAELTSTLRCFEREGLGAFIGEWEAMHALRGTRLQVRTAEGRVISGTADGIAPDGGLLLRNRRGLHAIHSGSVVRARADRSGMPA
jgi:BirA family biotin operon repressor/biotin-[acetyl-CoA-carboxylase] ligase